MPGILLVRHAQASFGGERYDVLSDHGHVQVQALAADLARRGVLQRRQRGRWRTVARGRLDRRLRFALRPRACRGGAHRVVLVRPRVARRVGL